MSWLARSDEFVQLRFQKSRLAAEASRRTSPSSPDHLPAPPPPTSSATDGSSSSSAPPSHNSSSAIPDFPFSIKESRDDSDSASIPEDSSQMVAIHSDLSEIGVRFKLGISMLASGNKTVNEISWFASSFLPFSSVDEEDSEEAGDESSAEPLWSRRRF